MPRREKKAIDGLEVACSQFGVMRQARLLAKLQGVVDGGTIALLGSPLLLELLAGTTVERDGRVIALTDDTSIDLALDGRLDTLVKIAEFAQEVNYGGFTERSSAASERPLDPKA